MDGQLRSGLPELGVMINSKFMNNGESGGGLWESGVSSQMRRVIGPLKGPHIVSL